MPQRILMSKPTITNVSVTAQAGSEPIVDDWEIVPDISWHNLLSRKPVELIARKRKDGQWIYRKPTKEEVAEYLSRDAW
jgi:hypothetical protein